MPRRAAPGAARARRGGRRRPAAGSAARPRGDARGAARAPGLRPVDGRVHRDARAARPDAWPGSDLWLRRATDAAPTPERWRPWRAYAAMVLWQTAERRPVRPLRAAPPPALQVAVDDEVAAVVGDDLPVAAAQRRVRPPAVLDQPGLAHGLDRAAADADRAARSPRLPHAATARGVARRRSRIPWRQREAPLGHARVGVDGDDPQRGVRPGDRAGLADRLAQPGAADRRGLGQQRALVARRRAEALRAQAQDVGRRGQLGQPLARARAASGAGRPAARGRSPARARSRPRPAWRRARPRAAHRPRRSRRASSRSISSSEAALELGAGGGLGQLEPLLQPLGGPLRGTSGVSLPCARSRASGPAGPKRSASAARGSLASSPSVRDPEALERVGQHRRPPARDAAARRAAAPCRRRARPPASGAISGRRARARPARARSAAKRTARRRGGRGAPSARPAPPRSARARVAASTPSSVPPCSVFNPPAPNQAMPGGPGSTAAPMPSSARTCALPRVGDARGVGRDEPQRRAARERLPQPQPGAQRRRPRRPRRPRR